MLATAVSLFKNTKPYLWNLRLIFHALHKEPPTTSYKIFDFYFHSSSAENMVKVIVKTVKAGPSGKLTECIVNKPNTSQIGLSGFWLASYCQCNNWINFQTDNFLKNVQKMYTLKNYWKFPFWQLIASLITSTCNTKYLEEKKFDFIFTCSEFTAQTNWRVSSLFWFTASLEAAQNIRWFLAWMILQR